MTGSAALYYLTNTEYRCDQSMRLRREVIQVVLNGMEQYQEVTVSPRGSGWQETEHSCNLTPSLRLRVPPGPAELLLDSV